MQLRLKYLAVCLLPATLFACGGGGGDAGDKNKSENTTIPPVINKYPEPTKDVVDDSIIGFYDYDKSEQTRVLRNDLNGDFMAMVQFAQSHVVNPKTMKKIGCRDLRLKKKLFYWLHLSLIWVTFKLYKQRFMMVRNV